MSGYVVTNWQDGSTPLNRINMMKIENELAALSPLAAGAQKAISYGTNPPASPADGDLWCFPADTTNGVEWLFRYRSAAGTFKWEFVGGPPLGSLYSPNQPIGPGVWTGGAPTITVPRQGVYLPSIFATATSPASGPSLAQINCGVDGVPDPAYNLVAAAPYASSPQSFGAAFTVGKQLGPPQVVSILYQANADQTQFGNRFLGLLPIRVS